MNYDVFSWVAIVVALHLVVSVAACYVLDVPDPARDGMLLFLLAWAFVLLLRWLMAIGSRRSALRHGFYNVGEAAYELQEAALRFAGSTFSCEIPYRSMTSVARYGKRAAIIFTPISGFLLPAGDAVTEGDLDAFVEALARRLEARSPPPGGEGER